MKRLLIVLPLLSALLMACPQPPVPVKPAPILEQPFKPTLLGRLTVQLGASNQVQNTKFVPSRLSNQALSPIAETSLVFGNQQFQTLDSGTDRFLMAKYNVTNNSGAALNNLTLVAYHQAGNAAGSPFLNVQTFGGNLVNVNTLRPAHGMKTSDCAVSPCVDNDNADLQIFKRSEINTLSTQVDVAGILINAGGTTGEGILNYGYVARNGNTGTYRTLANSTVGTITLALRVPQSTDAGVGSAYRYSMTFLVFADSTARVTESLEEQSVSGASARASALTGGASIASMCGTNLTSSTFIPGVRTVGVGTDIFWMGGNFFDSTETPLNLTGIIGNTEKTYAGLNGVLNGRFTALGGVTLNAVSRDISTDTTTNGGNIGVVAATGDTTIRPKVNSRIADGFTYQISDGTCTSPNINATIAAPTNTVWYVDSAAAAGGDGRSHTPFKNTSSFNLVPANTTAVNDFFYFKSSDNKATLTLKDNQQVVGAGEDLVVAGQTLQLAGVAPVVNTPLVVAANNTIKGLTFGTLTGTVGGTLTVFNASIAAGSNQAINLSGGILAIELTKVDSSGGANGIQLTNTTGILTVTGTGLTAESGGVLTGHTADGVNLATQFGSVTLKNMRISNSGNEGVEATPSTGTNLLGLEDVTINNVGAAVTTHDGVLFTASGTSNNTLEVIGTVAVTSGNAGTVASRIETGDSSGIRVNTVIGSSAGVVLKVEKTSIRQNEFFGILAQFQGSGATTTTIDDNRIDLITVDGSGIRIDADTPAQTHKLRIKGNTIDLHLGANTGASAGMDVKVRQAGILQALIETNTVLDAEGAGILVNAGSAISTANLQLSLLSNTATSSDPLPVTGILVKSGISSGTGATVCLNAVSNNINFSDVAANNYLLQRVTTGTNTFNLHGATGTPLTSSATVTSWLSDAPRSNLNTAGKTSILGSASPGYGTCTVVVPTF